MLGKIGWLALPFVAYLLMLLQLWFDAPVLDDFDAVLAGTMRLQDARNAHEWLVALAQQHNEHRIVLTRLAAWLMAELGRGQIDFRLLALLGNSGLAAILVLFWAEFRDRVSAVLLSAAGFSLCQMTYYETALTSMAAWSNIGVLAFAMAGFRFALLRGRRNAAAALVFGLLAAGSQANGLLALPLAACACALLSMRRRAWLFATVSVLLWLSYFANYQHPPHHGSPVEALARPLDAIRLFLIVIGGIAPGPWPAAVFGTLLLGMVIWLARGDFWQRRPFAALCIAFILGSAIAAAAGRTGFGVYWASRYAVNSSCLAAIVFLLVTERCSWTASQARTIFAAAAIASLALSLAIWPYAAAYSFRGRLLAEGLWDRSTSFAGHYFGAHYPDIAAANAILARAEARDLYRVRKVLLFAADLRTAKAPPRPERIGGALEDLRAQGLRVIASGWSDPGATVKGRSFVAHLAETPRQNFLSLVARSDVALVERRPELLFSGFRWEAEFESEEQARGAAANLCLVITAPDYPPSALQRNDGCARTHSLSPGVEVRP